MTTTAVDAFKVDQTIFASDPRRSGNCVAACAATFLGLRLNQVPHFLEHGAAIYAGEHPGGTDRVGWWAMLLGFMASRGLWPVGLPDPESADLDEVVWVAGMSERGVMHQVLYRNGELWHDPHPSRAGVIDVQEVLAWRRVGPFDHAPTPADRS